LCRDIPGYLNGGGRNRCFRGAVCIPHLRLRETFEQRCSDVVRQRLAAKEESTELRQRRRAVLEALPTLRGKNLACWCALPEPGEPDNCHAALLLELANT